MAFLALVFVATSALPSLAVGGVSGNITGTVINATTKAPIAGVTVTAASPSTTATQQTDAKGAFSFLGLPTDTYTITFKAPSFALFTLSGVTVQGDQTITLDPQPLNTALTTIGRTAARSNSSVFQPTQTIDSTAVSGVRAVIATGKSASVSENALALSVPGVQLTNANRLTVRGGLSNEVGYQFDGVPFTDPFLGQNQSAGRVNGLASLQVVEGAGDPTQGNIGSGAINIVVKRGARPAFGYADVEAGTPVYSHQFNGEYGWATPNGRLTNYTSYFGQRYVPSGNVNTGRYNVNQADVGNYFGTSSIRNDDFINNLVYKFGNNNNQSLQFLYQNRKLEQYGDIGGLTGLNSYLYAPYSEGYGRSTGANNSIAGTSCVSPASTPGLCSPAYSDNTFLPTYNPTGVASLNGKFGFYQNKIGLLPDTPLGFGQPNQPSQTINQPSQTLKFEYTNALNPTTFLTARYYNQFFRQAGENYYTGSVGTRFSSTGGNTTGYYLQLDKQVGDKHSLQFSAEYKLVHPIWDGYEPVVSYTDLLSGTTGSGPSIADFVNPQNPALPVSATNPCPAGAMGCYLFRSLYPNGDPNGKGIGRTPIFGINYVKTLFREYGASVRDQWSPSSRLKVDIGLRMDGANFSQGCNQYSLDPCGNPSDLDPNFLRGDVVKPHFLEPRTAIAYQMGANDAARFSYGRSITYPNAQTFGTPAYVYGAQAYNNVAPLGNTSDPATWTCGSTFNPQHAAPGGANLVVGAGALFQCQSYASQLHWLFDQNHDAPDTGNNTPAFYNNFDLSYSHQFKGGYSSRLTTYFKRGYSVPDFALISQVLDPTTGAPLNQVFAVANVGIEKTTGIELALATPVKPVGLSAYLSATYTNAINSTPPLVSGEDQLPLVAASSLALGNTYRVGFLSPFSINLGAQYKFRNGFRINPVLQYDRGYPLGAGLLTPSGAALGGSLINGVYQNIPATNYNSITFPGAVDYRGSAGGVAAPQYVDPVFPGSYQHPNIFATRGLPETAAAGGFLSKARLQTNLSLEYNHKRNTVGMYIANLIGSQYSEPQINPFWQPVANGIGGPLTGQQVSGNPTFRSGYPYLYGNRNLGSFVYGNQPLIEFPNNPTTFQVYYQLAL